jgi:hypothetical protein
LLRVLGRTAVGSFCNGAEKVRRAVIGIGFVPSFLTAAGMVGVDTVVGRGSCGVDPCGRFPFARWIDVAKLLMFW